MKKIYKILAILFLIGIGVFGRLLPHPPNFAPLGALSLFSGTYLNKKYFWLVPIITLWISDYFLGFYETKLMLAVYGSFVIISLIGLFLRDKKGPITIISCSLFGSPLFFLFTNFAVWLFTPWYSKDFPGLILCFTLALPFFRNTLFGDLFYNGLFFGIWELVLNHQIIYLHLRRFILTNTSRLVTIK